MERNRSSDNIAQNSSATLNAETEELKLPSFSQTPPPLHLPMSVARHVPLLLLPQSSVHRAKDWETSYREGYWLKEQPMREPITSLRAVV